MFAIGAAAVFGTAVSAMATTVAIGTPCEEHVEESACVDGEKTFTERITKQPWGGGQTCKLTEGKSRKELCDCDPAWFETGKDCPVRREPNGTATADFLSNELFDGGETKQFGVKNPKNPKCGFMSCGWINRATNKGVDWVDIPSTMKMEDDDKSFVCAGRMDGHPLVFVGGRYFDRLSERLNMEGETKSVIHTWESLKGNQKSWEATKFSLDNPC